MAKPISNDVVIALHRNAMHERSLAAAEFIASSRKRTWTVQELARVIFAAWEGESPRA